MPQSKKISTRLERKVIFFLNMLGYYKLPLYICAISFYNLRTHTVTLMLNRANSNSSVSTEHFFLFKVPSIKLLVVSLQRDVLVSLLY